MIEILRLNHRIGRDPRISTHVALTARAFGASKIYYSGDKDSKLEENINKLTKKFGGLFEIEHLKDEIKLIEEKKSKNFNIIHLTVYGKDFRKYKNKLKNKNLFIIVGGEKVVPEFYNISNFNLSVTNQPISEVSALGVFLYEINGYKDSFNDAKISIVGKEKGKLIKKI